MSTETVVAERQTHWVEKTLDQCATIQTGVSKGRKTNEEELVSVPYLRVANVQDGYLDLSEIKEIQVRPQEVARYALQTGDVLLTEGGDFDKLGRGFVWNGELPECIHQNHVFAVRVDQSQLDPHFFAYQAQSPHGKQYFLSVAHKTTNLACINTTKLKAFPVRVPPLSEQQEIVRILSTVKRAISAQERIIQTTTELKQALMQKLFSEGLRGEPQKETEIGLVPESWEVVEIGDIFKFTSGKTKPKDTAPKASDDRTVPVFGGNGILGYSSERLLDKETLILGRVGEYCGCAHLAPHASWVTDNALYASEERRAVNRAYIRTHFEHLNLNQHKNKMGQSLITQGIINTVKFGLPQAEEQDELAHTFETLDSRITQAQAKRDLLKELFRALLHELMTAQTRVI